MKITDLIEAPIADLTIYGADEPDGSFSNSDSKALRNPKWVKKVRNLYRNFPFNLNLIIFNAPNDVIPYFGKQTQFSGNETRPRKTVQNSDERPWCGLFPLDTPKPQPKWFIKTADAELTDAENSINVILVQNEGVQKVPLTPWIVGHRICHAILDRNDYSITKHHPSDVFMKTYIQNLSKLYKRLLEIVRGRPVDTYNLALKVVNLASEIHTFRSARTRNLANAGELFVECMTQYMINGKLIVNVPKHLSKQERDEFMEIIKDMEEAHHSAFEYAVGKVAIL
ncbi:hypothetical protein CL653_03570 [bacterium]|nr:hypothetical protein [bacterium]|tara:strand:+ start:273 stop:1121 length:849 start_codon:yes stop_codon:yes gene_type:complete